MDTVEELLEHTGIKGMRWGIRKRVTSATQTHDPSEDHMRALVAKSKPAYALSNNDMQALVTRMNIERQYHSAISSLPPPTKMSKVTKFVTNLMTEVGKEQVTRIARAKGMETGQKFGKQNLGLDIKDLLKKNK